MPKLTITGLHSFAPACRVRKFQRFGFLLARVLPGAFYRAPLPPSPEHPSFCHSIWYLHHSWFHLGWVWRASAALNTFRKGNDRLMKWLKPTVRILFLLLAIPGEGIGLVRPSFLPCILPQFLSLSCLLPLRRFSLVLVSFPGWVSRCSLACVCMTFSPGSEGRHCKLWYDRQHLRTYLLRPPASQQLHQCPTHNRNDGVAR